MASEIESGSLRVNLVDHKAHFLSLPLVTVTATDLATRMSEYRVTYTAGIV